MACVVIGLAADEQNQPDLPKITDIKSRFEHLNKNDAAAASSVQRYLISSHPAT